MMLRKPGFSAKLSYAKSLSPTYSQHYHFKTSYLEGLYVATVIRKAAVSRPMIGSS